MTADVAPVEVKNEDPIPVMVARSPDTTAQADARIIAASSAVDARVLTTQGQRRINLLWERTQAFVAVSVVATALLVVAVLILVPVLRGDSESATVTTGLVLLSGLVTNVVTSYFTRTNHTKTGGVGLNEDGR